MALRHLTIIHVAWAWTPPEVRKAFRTVLALPSLISITMTATSFPSLCHFTNLLNSSLKQLVVNAWFKLDDPADEEIISAIDGEDKIA
jgi:ABC-type sugar transport system permease subunit